MKNNPNNRGQLSTQSNTRTPQLAIRTDLRAGKDDEDKGCEAGIGYWRKEFNYWKNLAESMGCA